MATLAKDQVIRFGEDYETEFDVSQYLQSFVNLSPVRCFPVRELHKLCVEFKAQPESLTVLDIGTGPCISYTISVAPYASRIVLAEFATSNRATLTAWLENQKDAHDWTPYFKMVVTEMEGKDETEVEKRVAMVREKVKAVVPCDINKDPPIPQEYICQYDIVQSFLCLQAACKTKQDCLAGIAKMASLVKPGGKILLYFAERDVAEGASFYLVGSKMFFSLSISKASVLRSIEHAGFCDIKLTTLPQEQIDYYLPNLIGFYFLSATKTKEHTA